MLLLCPMAPEAVGHVVRDWLPRSATFVYTTVRSQRRVRPVVLAWHATNRDEFPVEPLEVLLPDRSPAPMRAASTRSRCTRTSARPRSPHSRPAGGWGSRC